MCIYREPSGLNVPKTLGIGGLDRNKSAVELCNVQNTDHRSTAASSEPPLRKISSVADCNSHSVSRKTSGVADWNSHEHCGGSGSSLLSSAIGYVTGGGSHSPQPTIPEDQGLTMSVRTAAPAFGASNSLASSSGVHLADISAHTHSNPLDESSTLNRVSILFKTSSCSHLYSCAFLQVKSGMLGYLNRGFLAKPVLNNTEENYRYIMTMDR